jgi:hypothetical protein
MGFSEAQVQRFSRISRRAKAHGRSFAPFQYAGLTGYDAVPSQGRIYEAAGISECPQWCGSATVRTGGASG